MLQQHAAGTNSAPSSERRRHYRATVVKGSSLAVRVWKIPLGVPLTVRPMPSQQLALDVRQVSAEGLTIDLRSRDGAPPQVSATDRLRVEFQQGDRTVLVEARLREPAVRPANDGPARAGIQLHGRPTDRAFREAVTGVAAIVGVLQREELRARGRDSTSAAAA